MRHSFFDCKQQIIKTCIINNNNCYSFNFINDSTICQLQIYKKITIKHRAKPQRKKMQIKNQEVFKNQLFFIEINKKKQKAVDYKNMDSVE